MITFLYIMLGVFMLSVLVIIHELGHFLAAKASKVGVKEFALGMGPKIFSYKGKETEYTVRAILIGGFVAFKSDEEFRGSGFLKRFSILIAGPVFNIALAYGIFLALSLRINFAIIPAMKGAYYALINAFTMVYEALIHLITGVIPITDLSGPVGIVHSTSMIVPEGLQIFMIWAAIVSVNLAIVNMVPIPIFDGGQIFMLILEKLKLLTSNTEKIMRLTGVVLVLAIFALGLWNDVGRIFFG